MLDFLAAAIGGSTPDQVEIADPQHRPSPPWRCVAPGLDARQQFGKGERLDEMIVAAAAQAAHAVVDFAERANDQGRRIDAGVAESRMIASPSTPGSMRSIAITA